MDETEDNGYLASSSSNNDLSLKGDTSRRPSALSFQLSAPAPRLSVVSITTTRHTASFSSALASASVAAPVLTIPDAPQPTLSSRHTHDVKGRGAPISWGASPRAALPNTLLNLPSSPIRKSSVTFADDRRPSLPISIPGSSVGGYSRRGSAMDPSYDLSKSEPGPSRLSEPWDLDVGDIFGRGGFMLGGYSAPAGIMSAYVPPDSPDGGDAFLSMIEADDPEYAARKAAWSLRLKTKFKTELSNQTTAIWICPQLDYYEVSQLHKQERATFSIHVTIVDSHQSDPSFPTIRVTMETGKDPSFRLQQASADTHASRRMGGKGCEILLAPRTLHEEAHLRRQREELARRATQVAADLSAAHRSASRTAKRSSSIGRLVQAAANQSHRHLARQPSITDFFKRAFGFKRPIRSARRASLSPPAMTPVDAEPCVCIQNHTIQTTEIRAFTTMMDVGPEDVCMVVPLSRDPTISNGASSRAPKHVDPRAQPFPFQAPQRSPAHLLICYVPWVVTSKVPMSPAQELRHQNYNEDLAALYAKFRSYRILARPMKEREMSTGDQSPREPKAGDEPPLQLIGFCESPLQGVEFVPETLRAVGICEMKAVDDVWHPAPDEWRNTTVTPAGREVMHLVWAGCVALSGLGRI